MKIDRPPPPEVIAAARTLEGWVTRDVATEIANRDYSAERPAELLGQLRFFLDTFDPKWRERWTSEEPHPHG